MLILVNHDNHIEGSAELTKEVRDIIEDQLHRFNDQITRIEVQLSDESGSAKAGKNDKRCMLEVRLAGLDPMSVTDRGNSPQQVVRGAAHKLEHLIESTLGKLNRRNRHTHVPIPGAELEEEREED